MQLAFQNSGYDVRDLTYSSANTNQDKINPESDLENIIIIIIIILNVHINNIIIISIIIIPIDVEKIIITIQVSFWKIIYSLHEIILK